jgi:hypothetical protein
MSELRDIALSLLDMLGSVKMLTVDLRREITARERTGEAPDRKELEALRGLGVDVIKVRNLLNNVLLPMLNSAAGREERADVYTPVCPTNCRCQSCQNKSA